MSIGSKSILFGVHQFLLHPLLVWISWWKLYGRIPGFRESVCILFHDFGYIFKRDIDGGEGIYHPRLGAAIVGLFFGEDESRLVLYHSRTLSSLDGEEVSILCMPDKLSILLYPDWLYLLLSNLSKEIYEYKFRMGMTDFSNKEWLLEVKYMAYNWALNNASDCERKRIMLKFSSFLPLEGRAV